MNGTGRDNDASRPVDSLASFEHLEGALNSQSEEEPKSDLPFDVIPPDLQPTLNGYSQEHLEDQGIVREEHLTNESLGGDILHFDDEHETSGLLNESELLNHRDHQYDSGSNCPSEDMFHSEGNLLGKGSSMELLQKYVEATPRVDTSLPELNYASDGLDDGYSDDVFDHHEHFYNNNNDQYSEAHSLDKSDQIRYYHQNTGRGIVNGGGRTPADSQDLSDESSTELKDTIVATSGLTAGGHSAGADEENYGDDPPDSKDSDSASVSIGQFVPNAVNRNRLPRPLGKPMKRSTQKTNEKELTPPDLNESHQGSSGSRSARSSARNSPRVSAVGSHRSRNSPRYSERSEDPSDKSNHRHSRSNGTGAHSRSPVAPDTRQGPNGIPRLQLQRNSTASSANLSLSSDLSKLDLSLRLQEESRTRQQADELVQQLQKNYDELLSKYAQAENTIDQLKLGARVSLFGDNPPPRQGMQGTFSPAQKAGLVNFAQPQKAAVHQIMSSSSHPSGGQGGHPTSQTGHSTMGAQTNNNNAMGPADTRLPETGRTTDSGFPAGEGILMALAFRVKSHQEQVDSFGALLQENQLAPSEQKTVLDRLRADQGKLEADYMLAKEEHNALRRRNSLLSGGAEAAFDPDRALEGEIFQLGMTLEDIAEIVQNNLRNNPPTTLPQLQANQPLESAGGNGRPQEQLQQDLGLQFQNARQAEERYNYTDGGDEPGDPGAGHDEPHLSYRSEESISHRESPEEEGSYRNDAPSLFSPPKASRQPQAKGTERNSRQQIPADADDRHRRAKHSQLSRPTSLSSTNKTSTHDPHGPSDNRQHPADMRGNAPRQKPPENGFMSPEADSGFMGSESSRQSNQNGGFHGHNGRDQLRKPREKQSQRSSRLPLGQRSPPQVSRRLQGEWESPQFSDYDISERDEDMEDSSTQSSGGAGKRKPGLMEPTPAIKSTQQTKRQSPDKLKQRVVVDKSERPRPSATRHLAEKQQRDPRPTRDLQRTQERRRTPERRGAEMETLKNPHRAWNEYRDSLVAEPELASNYRHLPKQGRDALPSRHKNPTDVTRLGVNPTRESRAKGPFDVPRRQPRVVPREQFQYDTESDVTQSSGKSEVIRDLQGEIENLKRQMAKLNRPEESKRPSPSRERVHRPRSSFKRNQVDSVGSDAGSGRSELLRALQNEIDDLRNQISEQETPPPVYGSPLSRTPLREPPTDDFRDRSHFSSPPPRNKLRETLRQTYIPQSAPWEPSFMRTPTQPFLPSGSPYRSRLRNPVPQYESTPFISTPGYIPKASSFAQSPSRTLQSYNPSRFLPSRIGLPPESEVASSPVYNSKPEPCPTCGGSGVHTHGDYTYPSDQGHLSTNPPRSPGLALYESNVYTSQSGSPQYSSQPVSNLSQNQPVYNSSPPHGSVKATVNTPQNQASFPNPGQQSTFHPHPQVLNQQAAQNPQPVLTTQPVSNSVTHQPQSILNQPQPVLNQPQQVLNQVQPGLNQPQPVLNQTQPVLNQPQSVLNQPQPVLNPPQTVLNQPQPVVNPTSGVPSNQDLPQASLLQTPVPGQTQTVLVPMVTIPVYGGIPVSAASQGTSETGSKNKSKKKPRETAVREKSTSGPQDAGGTTIYITPTKRRGRYYVLDDDEMESSGMEEEYYFRRTPRGGSSTKVSSFIRKSKASKYAHRSNLDVEEAIKMANELNQSSHRMLEKVRNDISQSQFL